MVFIDLAAVSFEQLFTPPPHTKQSGIYTPPRTAWERRWMRMRFYNNTTGAKSFVVEVEEEV
jgi:hypothetical protein